MLACYCLQGKQLASGVIGLLTCQSHYNVSGINRTPCARLLLRHPLAQHIPTEACECFVSRLINRTGVVDDDREIQEVTGQVGRSLRTKQKTHGIKKTQGAHVKNKHNRHVTARVP